MRPTGNASFLAAALVAAFALCAALFVLLAFAAYLPTGGN